MEDFRETERVERPISAMKVHIDYQAQLSRPWLPPIMCYGHVVFQRSKSAAQELAEQSAKLVPDIPPPAPVNLDAFKVRDQFHALDTRDKDAVLAFLNATGDFWAGEWWELPEATLEQIEEWQKFSKEIHCNNLAEMPLRVREALSGNGMEKCFPASYHPYWDNEYYGLLNDDPPDKPEDIEEYSRRRNACILLPSSSETRHREFCDLVQWFLCPPNGMLMVHPEFRFKTRQSGTVPLAHAEIKASTVLEAVAACAWVERFGGVQYRKCELPGCEAIFKVTPGQPGPRTKSCTERHGATFRKQNERQRAKEDAAAQERARRKKKAADKPTKAIQHPKIKTKRGTK